VPFTFKWAVDALTGEVHPPEGAPSWALWMFAAPILLTAASGGTRILMALLTQCATAVRQGGDACGAPARLLTFEHMHLTARCASI
jgi:ATP-binding cassette subfamily B protein